MSWSIGHKGTRAEVLIELREQIRQNDNVCQQSIPIGMSDTENTLRRQAQTLLYEAVRAHNIAPDSTSYLANQKIIDASAWGSESRASNGDVVQTINVSISTSPAD